MYISMYSLQFQPASDAHSMPCLWLSRTLPFMLRISHTAQVLRTSFLHAFFQIDELLISYTFAMHSLCASMLLFSVRSLCIYRVFLFRFWFIHAFPAHPRSIVCAFPMRCMCIARSLREHSLAFLGSARWRVLRMSGDGSPTP